MSAPVYVKLDEYKQLVELVDIAKERVNEARKILEQVEKIKQQEDQEIITWNREIKEVIKKIEEIDRILIEPKV